MNIQSKSFGGLIQKSWQELRTDPVLDNKYKTASKLQAIKELHFEDRRLYQASSGPGAHPVTDL